MRGFFAAAVGLVLVQAKHDKRQASASCNMTTVETVLSGTETFFVQSDTVTMHATTTVTVLALDATSSASGSSTISPAIDKREARRHAPTQHARSKRQNAPPGSYNTKRDLVPRSVCTEPTATVTTTVGSTTITKTTMHTLSGYARATVTAAACDANDNFGLSNGTLSRNLYYAYGKYPDFVQYNNLTIEQCCRQCFQSEDGCMAWSYGGTVNNTDPVQGCIMALYDGGCPSQWGSDTIMHPNNEKSPVGMGPCNVKVAWF